MISSLKSQKKIETIFEKGFVIKEKGLLLKAYDFKDDETKFGVSVSKKKFPTAVKRNLIKRRLRACVRKSTMLAGIPKGVCFFLIYTSNSVINSDMIFKTTEALLKKLTS